VRQGQLRSDAHQLHAEFEIDVCHITGSRLTSDYVGLDIMPFGMISKRPPGQL
jgi:hypothetical protein